MSRSGGAGCEYGVLLYVLVCEKVLGGVRGRQVATAAAAAGVIV